MLNVTVGFIPNVKQWQYFPRLRGCATGLEELHRSILSSKGQSSWKAAILGGGGECSWPTAPGALETFLDGVCVVCQRLHSAGGHSHHLKEPRTLCPVIRAMCPQSSFLTQLKVSFFLLCSCRLPPGFRITVLHNFKSVEES